MHIAIAGNIGSGKTTLARLLSKNLGYKVLYEDPADNPYINDFYSDMPRWSFNMQIYYLHQRLTQAVSIQQTDQNIVQDRTIYEDAEIFAPNLLMMGLMAQRDFDTYKSLYDSVVKLVKPPDLVIYLRASLSALVDQIASRNRDYEDSIRMDYLRQLNLRYDQWYESYNLGKKIDFSVDSLNFKDVPEHLGVILSKVSAELFGLF